MDADGDFEIDPAMAAAMGFSGFGAQKKRKFNANEGFVDPNIKEAAASSTGANSAHLGQKKAAKATHADSPSAEVASEGQQNVGTAGASLEALRQGVRNERGDMVYFLPSFLEDPWAGLEAQ